NKGLMEYTQNCEGIKKTLDLEIGFHIFLSELFLLTNADPVLSYKYLSALFAVISAFILFLIVKRYHFYAAIFSILFFTSLRTDIVVMGLWFFAPLTMSIGMIYGVVLALIRGIKKGLAFFFVLLLLCLLLHLSIQSLLYLCIL
ncbi:MAG: hypothetical protein ACK4YO_03635, partial [Candidatus Altarchaeaceae archaeon]